MRIRNHSRLALVFVTCSLAATAQAAPPASSDKRVVEDPQMLARGPAAETAPALRTPPVAAAQAESLAPFTKPATAAERASMMRTAEAKLAGEDVEAVEHGLALLSQLGGADAAKLVLARVRRGLPPQLVEPALTAMLSFKQQSVAPVLLELAQHRRWLVRQQAIDALAKLGSKSAQSALLSALDDPSDQVRASAVEALGILGDARALPALTVAHQRGVEGAALALGKLGNTKEAELLLAQARKGELPAVESGLHAMILRANLPLALKLKIVNDLTQIGSPASTEMLTVWAQSFSGGDARVLQALTKSAQKEDGTSAMAAKTAPAATQGDKP